MEIVQRFCVSDEGETDENGFTDAPSPERQQKTEFWKLVVSQSRRRANVRLPTRPEHGVRTPSTTTSSGPHGDPCSISG